MKKEEEERAIMELNRKESAIKGNPLMNTDTSASSKLKRRWNDDVVFRNQTRGEPEMKKRFINDTIRNDFHRSFLKKFMH
jgi:protein CWC15